MEKIKQDKDWLSTESKNQIEETLLDDIKALFDIYKSIDKILKGEEYEK